MKEIFNDEYTVKTLFEVFFFEDKKVDILALIEKFPEAECFAQMVGNVQDIFPKECFRHYEKKIQKLLIEAKVDLYPQVA